MSFFRRLFKRKENKQPSSVPTGIPQTIPESPEALMEVVNSIRKAGLPPEQTRQRIRYYITSLPDWLIRETYRDIITRLWRNPAPDDPPQPATRHLVSFRLSLYNPDYRERKDPGLGKLMMTLINLAPDLIRDRAKATGEMDAAMTTSEELDRLIADLSIFNLSESELKYTVARILEYNRHNVAYTEDEVIVLNNSELLRTFLERITATLQDFVQQSARWERYFEPDALGIPPIQLRLLNIHFREYFPSRREDALTQFRKAPSLSDLEREVPLKLRALFQRDVRFLVRRIRERFLEEHDTLLGDIRTNLCWHLQLLHELNELPPREVMASLMDKSMRFHHQYYPDLVKAVQPEIHGVLAAVGQDYRDFGRLKANYPVELARGMAEHARQYHGATIRYDRFLEAVRQRVTRHFAPSGDSQSLAADYQPEELNILKTTPDAEVAILLMNEKMARAEEREPILEQPFFYESRKDYLKVVLLETLQAVTSSTTPFKVVQSLLLKSLDRSRPVSAALMERMIRRLKEEGLHPDVVRKLLAKQQKKHHLATIIRTMLAEDPRWQNLGITGEPDIRLDKFSTVTGVAFFSAIQPGGHYKITARYEDGRWTITHIAPDSRNHTR